MGAESGLEGPAGNPLRDLGEGEERSGAEIGRGDGCWGGREARERVGGDVRPPG